MLSSKGIVTKELTSSRRKLSSRYKSTVCRLCLAHTRTHFSLINNEEIVEMLQALTSLKVLPNDEISTVMCLKCHLNLKLAYKIQQNMIKAEKRFHQVLQAAAKVQMTLSECNEIVNEATIIAHKQKVNFKMAKKKPKDKNSVESYPCDLCAKVYTQKSLLSIHKYSHKKVSCTVCDKEMLVPNLRIHMQCHEYDPHVCEICGSTFKGSNYLKIHIRRAHKATAHKCNYCEKSFKKNIHRVNHEHKEHLNQANYVCETCGKQFYSKCTLTKHVKMKHLKLRPYVCEFCKSAFSSLFAMKTHRRQHTNETPYKCDFCGTGFRQNVSLKSHLKSKHGVEEQLTHECDKCEKKFASKVALYTHQRTAH